MKTGIISDIHGDLDNLNNSISYLERKAVNELICLGDIAGKGVKSTERSINSCISIVRSNCNVTVVGNHDLNLINKLPEYRCGFIYPDNWFELSLEQKHCLAREEIWLYEEWESGINWLSVEDVRFIKSLAEKVVKSYENITVMYSHYLYPDVSGSTTLWVENDGQADAHLDWQNKNNSLIGFAGHAHIEGILICTAGRIEHLPFGSYQLDSSLRQTIIGPCITKGKKKSGLMIFDTNTFGLEVIETERI